MKRILLIAMVTILWLPIMAQNNGSNQLNDTTKYVYCQIVGTGRMLSNKVTIEIDFGQFRSFWEDNRLKDPATGERVIFNGMIDALNYMANQGWEFVQAYAFAQGNGPMVYHYLLKKSKKIMHDEEKNESLKK